MEKRNIWLFVIISILFFSIILVSAIPALYFIFQNPSDINTTNLYTGGLNISYNLTDILGGINASSVLIFFKTNSSSSDISFYLNGTSYTGYFNESGTNQSANWTFGLDDNEVYPADYNLNPAIMENTPHAIVGMTSGRAAKIQFLNVSNSTQYNIFEFMANSTVGTSSLFIFYCNSSYNSGTVTTNINCIQFGSLAGTPNFNITNPGLNNSKYQLYGFIINTTTGKAQNSVYVTPKSSFVLRNGGAGTWNVYNIPLLSRTGAIQTSTNNGVAWTNQTYTPDAHFHQYDGTNTFYYYVCGSNSTGTNNCSSIRTDLLEQAGLPPSVPHVYSPVAYTNYSGYINISYIAAISPNDYPILFYNISLANLDESFNKSIVNNNSLNLSYVWDSTGTPDGSYLIKVIATDNISQTSFDFSENFTVDNTNPTATLTCTPQTVSVGDEMTCSCGGNDATSGISSISFNPNPSTASPGDFQTTCIITDNAGNYNNVAFTYSVVLGGYSPSSSGGGSSGGGSSVSPQTQNNISTSKNETSPEINLSSVKEIINVPVENKNYSLNVTKITNDSVTFNFNGAEKEISVGETQTVQIGSSIVTLELKGISVQGAIFNVLVNKKSFQFNYQTIALIAVSVILLIFVLLRIFLKSPKHKKEKHKK